MKKYFISIFFVLSTLGYAAEIGAKAALNSKSLTKHEMLTYALQDEYLAKNEYQKTIDKFGDVRPFSNIEKSEEQHIDLLLPLFEKYNVAKVNENEIKEQVIVSASLKEALEACVQAEIDNIAMYNKFLSDENLPEDMKTVFIHLRDASKNHLRAFKNQLK